MPIIVSKNGENARMINPSGFENEEYLQEYIHRNPETIPLYELEKDRKLFIVRREFPTNSGPIDALAIDDKGGIYVIETKLYKNPDKRQVIAQALDYGAALWKRFNDFNGFMEIIRQEITKNFQISFEEKIKDFFDLDDDLIEELITSMKNNLDDGNMKFIILMDSIDERLKDLILYVNSNSRFDIYAVQFEYYRYEQYEIIIPKTYGMEVRKDIPLKSASHRTIWDREGFEREIQALNQNIKSKVKILMDFALQEGCLDSWGTGRIPSFYFKIPRPHEHGKKVTVFNVWSDGYIQVGYWLKEIYKNEQEKIGEFYKEINKIDGISGDENQRRQHRLALDKISNEGLEKLKRAVIRLKNSFDVDTYN